MPTICSETLSSPTQPIDSNKDSDRTSPSTSSQAISIRTIDDNDDSSVAESDVEADFDDRHYGSKGTKAQHPFEGYGTSTLDDHCVSTTASNSALKPNIGSIAVQNSSDITFGNKTFYQGPVTIERYMYENNEWRPTNENEPRTDGEDGTGKPQINHKFTPTSWHNIKRPILLTIAISIVALLVATLTLTTVFLKGDDGYDGNDIPIGPNPLRLVTRLEWLAQPTEKHITAMELPAIRVIIAQTSAENCSVESQCIVRVRTMQTNHLESFSYEDIIYNFLVGGDGSAYEGRGWDKQGQLFKGANSYNRKSISIAFIGTFNVIVPPEKQLRAAQLVIDLGVKLKKLHPKYKLFGHRQLDPHAGPDGTALYNNITHWPHWSEDL